MQHENDSDDEWGVDAAGSRSFTLDTERAIAKLERERYAVWNPTPVGKPAIDRDLPELSWPERTVEVLVYSVLSFEYWLSPGGLLREWIRLNVAVGVVLMVCAVILVPSLTAVLKGAVEWTLLSAEVAQNMTNMMTAMPPIILALGSMILLFKVIKRYWLNRRYEVYPSH
ncbi:hypothetical protein [Sulfuriroseicoccus oceanibius]|uniref:Uncharacterized protein n=1 Tax=Sulfuriroseicoccus oceanibius TaxID=2707525 RepID=A0A6B3L4L0_9BACT|nr:hypothetical protein [Sulfuriroseicoccus oceanibius]QQL43738.1 hypothetical protein G3M56_007440 [Sulfuriroseicoccus oceanibius]